MTIMSAKLCHTACTHVSKNYLKLYFGDVLKNLDDQELSTPFQTQVGWHIVQRLGVRENDVTDEIKRRKAERSIHARKMNEQIESWLIEIRGEAFIDIRI